MHLYGKPQSSTHCLSLWYHLKGQLTWQENHKGEKTVHNAAKNQKGVRSALNAGKLYVAYKRSAEIQPCSSHTKTINAYSC